MPVIWTFMGIKMAVTHFVTQFTNVSKHFGDYIRKKKILRKTVLKIQFQIKKMAYLSTKLRLEKNAKTKKKFKTKKT